MGNPGHAKNNTFDLFWIKHDKTPFCWFQSILLLFETHIYFLFYPITAPSSGFKAGPKKPKQGQQKQLISNTWT
jgi:hypothetical protein